MEIIVSISYNEGHSYQKYEVTAANYAAALYVAQQQEFAKFGKWGNAATNIKMEAKK